MKISELGEFGFIDRVAGKFNHFNRPGITGIGDDCAIIPYNEEKDLVITTDLLIEDIHFLKNRISPFQLGYKSLAVNLSDIAAMGAQPVGSLLSIGLSAETEVEYLDAFTEGFHSLSVKYNVPLLGGDTTQSKKYLIINVAVIGQCPKGKARLRSMAQDGDIVCVTGYLGDSAGGLEILLHNITETKDNMYLTACHHQPEPQIKEGQWLAQYPEVHAMMDISDGISSDLAHIVKASNKSAIVDLERIPVSDVLKRVAFAYNWDIDRLAVSGGEDYVLLCTVDKEKYEELSNAFLKQFSRPLFAVGRITHGNGTIVWTRKGKEVVLSQHGFDHFKS